MFKKYKNAEMLTTLGPTADSVQTPKLESLFQKPWQILSSNQHNVLNPTAHSNITQQKLTNQQPGASGSLLKPRLNAGRCVEQTGSLHHLHGRSGNKSNDNNNLNFFNTPQKTQFSRDFFLPPRNYFRDTNSVFPICFFAQRNDRGGTFCGRAGRCA